MVREGISDVTDNFCFCFAIDESDKVGYAFDRPVVGVHAPEVALMNVGGRMCGCTRDLERLIVFRGIRHTLI